MPDFQNHVNVWVLKCFGASIAADKSERNHRFLEEALELVQAGGCTKEEALKLVEYVYNRPVGDVRQEVEGVGVTLAALCTAHKVNMEESFWGALERCHKNIEVIREKNQNKPRFSPLPGTRDT